MPTNYKYGRVKGSRIRIGIPGLSKTQAKSVRKIAKKTVKGMSEKKHFGFSNENVELYHNKTLFMQNWLKCSQGVTDPNNQTTTDARIGDEITLTNINIKFWLSNKGNRPNVMYRAILFWYDSTVPLSDAVCFFTQQNKMLDRPNSESISVIDQKYIFSANTYAETGNERSQLCTLKKAYQGRKIIYDEGGPLPKKRTIGALVVCYDAYGTLQTDNIASLAYNGQVTFIDL